MPEVIFAVREGDKQYIIPSGEKDKEDTQSLAMYTLITTINFRESLRSILPRSVDDSEFEGVTFDKFSTEVNALFGSKRGGQKKITPEELANICVKKVDDII